MAPNSFKDAKLTSIPDLIQMGLTSIRQGELDRAIACFLTVVEKDPANVQAHYNLGLANKQVGALDASLNHYMVAAQLAPADADIFFNWGNALLAAGDHQAAINIFRQAVALRPEVAEYHTNLAAACQERGDLEGAVTHFQAALDLEPRNADHQWNLSLVLLKMGEYARAWPLFEARLCRPQWRTNYPHRYDLPSWQGESFRGRHLLVHFEQGFGDTLQFMRYLPRVKALGGRVTLEVPGTLIPLAETLTGVDAAIEFSYARPACTDADLHVPLMSLAGIFHTRIETIPSQFPYLQAPSDRVEKWQNVRDPKALNIGLVWAGKDTDPLRACYLTDLEPLLNLPGINWIGLQKGRAVEEMAILSGTAVFRNIGSELTDFGDTAALIHNLDLVVSVDTAVAHLTGALGKPGLCLLRACADWRWLVHGERSPWYPSLSLFRQIRARDWSTPVRAIAAALVEMQTRRQPTLDVRRRTSAQPLMKASETQMENLPQILFRQAVKQSAAGELKAAIATYQRLLDADPDHVLGLFNLGISLRKTGELAAARRAYEGAIAKDASFIDARYNLANLLLSQRCYSEAVAQYERILELNPNHLNALLNTCVALVETGQDVAAHEHLEAALTRWPDSAAVHHQMGQLLSRQGKWPEAALYLEEAVARASDNTTYRYNLGHARFQKGDFAKAAQRFREVLTEDPNHVAAKVNLGTALKEMGAVDEAETCLESALQTEPNRAETRWNLALVRLLKGDYPRAWPDFEARWEKSTWHSCYPFRFEVPRWQGQSLAGKTLFVHDEQGLGDVLQFVRYLSLLKSLGGRVLFETRAPLTRLCAANKLVDEVLLRGETPHLPVKCDFTIPLMSLPGIFSHNLDQVPNKTPYLSPPADSVARWADALPKRRPRVGLVWSGRPTTCLEPPGLRGRSCGLSVMRPLIEAHPELCFVGVQKGAAAEEIVALEMDLLNLGPRLRDFADTTGVLAHLDLIITVDTAVAHLAGAMGKPVWVLLQQVPDWRWLLHRDNSPWYPSARLFRQCTPGDWDGVIAQISFLLKAGIFVVNP